MQALFITTSSILCQNIEFVGHGIYQWDSLNQSRRKYKQRHDCWFGRDVCAAILYLTGTLAPRLETRYDWDGGDVDRSRCGGRRSSTNWGLSYRWRRVCAG